MIHQIVSDSTASNQIYLIHSAIVLTINQCGFGLFDSRSQNTISSFSPNLGSHIESGDFISAKTLAAIEKYPIARKKALFILRFILSK